MTVCTLCIPRTKDTISHNDIKVMFGRLKWGNIHNICIHTSNGFSCIFIKLGWFKSQYAQESKRMLENDCINVVYNFDIYKIVKRQPRKKA